MYKEQTESLRNALSIAFVKLAENETFDDTTIKEHSDLFLDYEVGVAYKQKDIFNYEGEMYKVLQDHTSQENWKPNETPSLYKKIGNPTDEYPEWSQPIGAGDSYMTGDKVTFENKHYISIVDNNVWKPDVYGWEEI